MRNADADLERDAPALRARGRRAGVAGLALCLVGLAGSPLGAQVIERVLAVVDGRVITLLDVQAARTLRLVDATGQPDQTQAVLSQLIDRALILDEVDRYAPAEPDPAAVDRGLAAIRERFPSQAAYEQALAQTGMESFAVRQWVRNDLRIQAYLEQRFASAPEAGAAGATAQGERARERIADDRRDALVREWVDVLRARARISRP